MARPAALAVLPMGIYMLECPTFQDLRILVEVLQDADVVKLVDTLS
ncbi:hypothetical protein AZ27_3855 [Bordetella bronchiseptica D756]|nr:hypothetical protein AZ27_3855 [Bordetella bronchiseptica D756]